MTNPDMNNPLKAWANRKTKAYRSRAFKPEYMFCFNGENKRFFLKVIGCEFDRINTSSAIFCIKQDDGDVYIEMRNLRIEPKYKDWRAQI